MVFIDHKFFSCNLSTYLIIYCCAESKEFPKSPFKMLSTRAKRRAHQKPSTENPGISQSQAKITSALITNKKRPSVRTVIGKVNNTKSGLTVRFIRMITAARINPVITLSSCIPGSRNSAMVTAIPPIRILIK